jgi:putative transposase
MKRHRHTPEQAIRKVLEGERLLNDGKDLAEILRTLEISEATWNRWRSQYGGMKASEAKRLKELEAENARLKKLVANQALDIDLLKELARETSDPGAAPQGRRAPAGPLRGVPTSRLPGRRPASHHPAPTGGGLCGRGGAAAGPAAPHRP